MRDDFRTANAAQRSGSVSGARHELLWRLSFSEVATLAQVQRPVATTWARRHADVPKPVTHDGSRPLFDTQEVVGWLLATGRGNAAPQHLRAELILHTLAGWRDRLPAHVLVGALTGLICLR